MGEISERMSRIPKPTKGQRKLFSFLNSADPRAVASCTITELARETGVAEATVLRFCRALGYCGYTDFRLSLARERDLQAAGDVEIVDNLIRSHSEEIERIGRTLDANAVKRACMILRAAATVHCCGASSAWGREFKERLLSLGIFAVSEETETMRRELVAASGGGDVLLLLGEGEIFTVSLARSRGVRILAVGCGSGELTRAADCALFPALPEGKIARQFLVDVFCTALYRSDRARFDAAKDVLQTD